jgi:penicillin-binding protein 1A
LWFYVVILRGLPDFDKIKDWFSQSTNITNRDGKTLYKVFAENRQYVPISDVSEHMIHAIVSAEDKNFWTNQWVDVNGILRAGLSAITKFNLKWGWGSTITQQLIKNVFLTNEKSIVRKLKEIVLAMRIDDYLDTQVRKENPELSSSEKQKAIKNKILEMYMNYVFLGNNAYWVEAASNTYYGKKAKDLTVLESAVLASTFQLPSTFNPYRNTDRLMGDLVVTFSDDKDVEIATWVQLEAKNKFMDAIQNSDKKISKSWNGISDWLVARGTFDIEVEWKRYNVTYTPGRKDYVLSRMFEDSHVDEAQIKKALLEWLDYVFKTARVNIEAPHFVFWIQEFLKSAGCEQKLLPRCFTEEELAKWWLQIKTSLDGEAQTLAEKSITDNMATINWYWANNSSLVYIDSRDGDVLAYVWSADYNNKEIDGNVDIVQQQRQPWSSIKPLIYTYWFMNLPLTIDTTIYDLKFKIWNDEPNNNDWWFEWPIPLKRALWHSRNIPAIKMYFAVWWQDKLVPFLNDVGIKSYDAKKDYWYPLAIGAWELKMLELANGYMHLSAMWRPAKINPILEIKWADGQIIYQKQPQQQAQIIPEWVAYLMWKILSDSANLPTAWVNNFLVRWLTYANKSWTTNLKDPKTNKNLPRDWWLAWYTPSKVAIFWAWNTQWNAMNINAYGWWVNGKTFRQFFTWLLKDKKIQTEDVSQVEVKNVSISKVSGKLVWSNTPESYRISTIWYINTLPTLFDDSLFPLQIDKACWWKVTDATPRSDIMSTYLIKPSTFMPNGMDLKDITNWYASKAWTSSTSSWTDIVSSMFAWFFLKAPDTICENRQTLTESSSIQLTIRKPSAWAVVWWTTNVWYDISSTKPIINVRILVNDINLAEFAYAGKTNLSDIKKITLPQWSTTYSLSVVAIDNEWGFAKKTVQVSLSAKDEWLPYLLNDKISVTKKWDGTYDVVMLFVDDESAVKWWRISMMNGIELKKFEGNIVSLNIQVPQDLAYEITDTAGNVKKGKVDVSSYVQ